MVVPEPPGQLGSLTVKLLLAENRLDPNFEGLPNVKVHIYFYEQDAIAAIGASRIATTDENGLVEFSNLENQELFIGFSYQDSTYLYQEKVSYNSRATAEFKLLNNYEALNTFFSPFQRILYRFQLDSINDQNIEDVQCTYTEDTLVVEVVERLGLSSWKVREYFKNRTATDSLVLGEWSETQSIWTISQDQLIISNETEDIAYSFLFMNCELDATRLDLSTNHPPKHSPYCHGYISDYLFDERNNTIANIQFDQAEYKNILIQRGLNEYVPLHAEYYQSSYYSHRDGIIRVSLYNKLLPSSLDTYLMAWERIQ